MEEMDDIFGDLEEAFAGTTIQRDLPAGQYMVEIVKMNLEMKAPKGGTEKRPVFTWTLKILEGEFRDRRLYHTNLVTENTMKFVRQDFSRAGFEPTSLAELQKGYQSVTNKKINIRYEIRDHFKNTHILPRGG